MSNNAPRFFYPAKPAAVHHRSVAGDLYAGARYHDCQRGAADHRRQPGGQFGQSTWVITSFAVSNAIALPLTGWLSRRFGEVKLFLWATILFVIASFLCGISQSMPELVGFRALQGMVAGPLYPMSQTLLIAVYPPAKGAWPWHCWRW